MIEDSREFALSSMSEPRTGVPISNISRVTLMPIVETDLFRADSFVPGGFAADGVPELIEKIRSVSDVQKSRKQQNVHYLDVEHKHPWDTKAKYWSYHTDHIVLSTT